MERARAAERDERQVAWVDAALDRDLAQRLRHGPHRDPQDRVCGLFDGAAKGLGDALDRGARALGVDRVAPRERGVCREPAEDDVRVRDGRRGVRPSTAVAGRAGVGACALRAHPERAAGVDPRDAPPAGADRVDVERREREVKAADAAARPHGQPAGVTGTSATSVDVPPISNASTRGAPRAEASAPTATMPPAGPESAVAAGSSDARSRLRRPPEEAMTSTRPASGLSWPR